MQRAVPISVDLLVTVPNGNDDTEAWLVMVNGGDKGQKTLTNISAAPVEFRVPNGSDPTGFKLDPDPIR